MVVMAGVDIHAVPDPVLLRVFEYLSGPARAARSVGQAGSRSVSRSVSQSVSLSVNQTVGLLISQSVGTCICGGCCIRGGG
jgi:hypothetical protein